MPDYLIEIHATDSNKDENCRLEERYFSGIDTIAQVLNEQVRGLVLTHSDIDSPYPEVKIYNGYPSPFRDNQLDEYFSAINFNETTDVFICGRYFGSCVGTTLNQLLTYLTQNIK